MAPTNSPLQLTSGSPPAARMITKTLAVWITTSAFMIEKIGAVVDGCSLLLEYLTICTEEGIISAKKAGIWTKKVTDVKYPAMKWLTSERGRAEKLRAEAERKRLTEQAAALKSVLYPEP